MLAARLLSVGAFVFLAPGLAILARMPGAIEWPEHMVYAFAISYVWLFALSIILPVAGWTVDHAALLTLALAISAPLDADDVAAAISRCLAADVDDRPNLRLVRTGLRDVR